MLELILGGIAALAIAGVAWLWKENGAEKAQSEGFRQHLEALRARFAPVLDAEAEAARVYQSLSAAHLEAARQEAEAKARLDTEITNARKDIEAARHEMERKQAETRGRQEELARSYQAARETFERLQREVSLVEENLEDISFGVYKPHYEFASSQQYKDRLEIVWLRQKDCIKAERHVTHGVAWTIGDSRKEGERMQKQYGKLLLRAFNGECEACIAKVAWNNVTKMEERIRKAFDAINELGGVMKISVTPEYREIRLDELRLHYELEVKKREEAEEQRSLREQMREEERVQRELERAREEAEDEEKRYQKALEKARTEMAQATGARVEELSDRVQQLQAELEEARRAKERAISQAQLTRMGNVYVISNVGSFGEEVLKIGMTRRLDPMERVKELGDASVPFPFDVHGMIQSDDAPALEHELHTRFRDRCLNMVNCRKEFFRVSVKEVDEFLRTKRLQVELTLLAEAREFRESLALRKKAESPSSTPEVAVAVPASGAFPDKLF